MFKNSHFVDIHEEWNDLVVWHRDVEGKLETKRLPLRDYNYCFQLQNSDAPTPHHDLYGYPLRKIHFDNFKDIRDFSQNHDNLCESDVQPTYKLALDEFLDSPMDSPVNIMLFDIEADYDLSKGLGYPLPSNPYAPINSFQYFDRNTERYGIIHTCNRPFEHPKDPDGFPIDIIECKSEIDLLLTVADLLETLDVDLLTAWNGDGFDVPYIFSRAMRVLGENEGKALLNRGGYRSRGREYVDAYGNPAISWGLIGRHHLDMMDLYKKFMPGEKASFSLSAVCEEDLGMDKVDYDGDLGDLYRTNPTKFFEYAFWDAKLLKGLDDMHQIMNLAVVKARMECVKLSDVLGAVRPIESGLMKFAHAKGIRLPDRKDNHGEAFEGAIVYDVVSGRHGWVFSTDLSSLYPSTMIMLGLSPETMVMELEGGYSDYIKVMTRSQEEVNVGMLSRGVANEWIRAKGFELEEMIRESGWTISAAGIIFNGRLGLLAEYVQHGLKTRAKYRKMSRDAFSRGDEIEGKRYDLYQNVIKIGNNSVYGASGNAGFRLYDLRMSRSITLSAQVISKFQAQRGNSLVEELKGE